MHHHCLAPLRTSLSLFLIWLTCCATPSTTAMAQGQKWVASWAASAHGPYPAGNPSAQPSLQYAIESAELGTVLQKRQTATRII